MGLTEQWTLYRDGRLESGKGAVIKLSPDEAQSIQRKMLDRGFIQLSRAVKPPSGCADCIWMTVTVYENGQKYEIQTNLVDKDTTENERLIIEDLETWLRGIGSK